MRNRDMRFITASLDAMRVAVFVLSAMLIVYISYDTFTGRNFLENHRYMQFQLWVCVFFIVDFFYELAFSDNKRRYLRTRWLFLLLSIPYLNIITYFHLDVTPGELYWLRFVPLGRATMALAIVVGYISKNRISSMLASYLLILVAFIYFGSIIFFNAERGLNADVSGYWSALWWACMDATTIGCDIQPVTAVGKVVSAVLACMGVLVFPLFTVYVTSLTRRLFKS
ncbi:MAG: potassium channel family protein [Bacteroides sp.]|nr:potassium channel family protein [Bacteroides sp.]MCM1378495.1 potassium channel family protein [Bacteroides sp.]MCM1444796.1 potassium channel family protein [Prevotella sp.]